LGHLGAALRASNAGRPTNRSSTPRTSALNPTRPLGRLLESSLYMGKPNCCRDGPMHDDGLRAEAEAWPLVGCRNCFAALASSRAAQAWQPAQRLLRDAVSGNSGACCRIVRSREFLLPYPALFDTPGSEKRAEAIPGVRQPHTTGGAGPWDPCSSRGFFFSPWDGAERRRSGHLAHAFPRPPMSATFREPCRISFPTSGSTRSARRHFATTLMRLRGWQLRCRLAASAGVMPYHANLLVWIAPHRCTGNLYCRPLARMARYAFVLQPAPPRGTTFATSESNGQLTVLGPPPPPRGPAGFGGGGVFGPPGPPLPPTCVFLGGPSPPPLWSQHLRHVACCERNWP